MPRNYKAASGTPSEDERRAFSRRLYQLMREKGWSQSELAAVAFGTTVRNGRETPNKRDRVSEYINGRAFPDERHLAALAQAFGVEAGELAPDMSRAPVDRGNALASFVKRPDGRWRVLIDDVFTADQVTRLQALLYAFTDESRQDKGHGA